MRRKSRSKKRINFLHKKFLIPLFIFIFLLVFFFFAKSKIFIIKSVEINTTRIDCVDKNSLIQSANLYGQFLFFVNSLYLENSLKNKYYCIKRISITNSLPNKLKLNVYGREPALIFSVLKNKEATHEAIIANFSEKSATSSAEATGSAGFNFDVLGPSDKFIVDNEGIVYSTNIEQVNAPNIYLSGLELTLGQKLKEDLIKNSLKILEKVRTFGMEIKNAYLFSQKYLLLSSSPRIIFSLDSRVDEQIASLQLILQTAKIDKDSKSVEFIDLRFDKPIVRLVPKKK